MDKELRKNLVVVVGATAVGKTEVSVSLARHFKTEIISFDSRQFYREMNIGTAKPVEKLLEEIPHHFISSLSVTEDYNAGMFERDCLQLLEKLFKKYSHVVMTGGSGLYVSAVTDGFDVLPDADETIRKMLADSYRKEGLKFLQGKLEELDKEYFEKTDRNNPQRMMRAIEVCMATGKKYSELLNRKRKVRPFKPVFIGLELPKAELHERISNRVDGMMAAGLEAEVKKLLPHREFNSLQTVGYKEMFLYLEGKLSLAGATELIKKNTRSYAKRQMTWFRKRKDIKWFHPSDLGGMISHIGNEAE